MTFFSYRASAQSLAGQVTSSPRLAAPTSTTPLRIAGALPNLPTPRGSPSAAVIDGKAHVVGGVALGGKNTPAHEVHDVASETWSRRAAVPTPRDHFVLAHADGRLFAIGGRIDGSYARNLAVTEIYDPLADRWTAGAPMPTDRSGIVAAVLGGRIYVFGGEAPSGTFRAVEAYDPKTGTWTSHAPMPTARHGLGAAVSGGRIFVIAGGPRPGASASSANEIFAP